MPDKLPPLPPGEEYLLHNGVPLTVGGEYLTFTVGQESDLPSPPPGTQYLTGADGAHLLGADGAYLLGKRIEPDARADVIATLAELRAALAEIRKHAPLLGHNNPPESIEEITPALMKTADEIAAEVIKPAPDRSAIQRAIAKLKALQSVPMYIGRTVGNEMAKAVIRESVHEALPKLYSLIGKLISALIHWMP